MVQRPRIVPVATAFALAALASLAALPAAAQGITSPGASLPGLPPSGTVTIQAKITAIDPQTRAITLRGGSGHSVTLTAGPAVRLEMLKVGDTVDALYTRAVAFHVSGPGEAVPEDDVQAILARNVSAPGGVAYSLTRISATVVGIDLQANSIDVVDPSGGAVYSIAVTEPSRIAMLPKLKIGDTITAVVGQALALSVTPAPKSWF